MISRGRLQSVNHRKRRKQRLKIRSIVSGIVIVLVLVTLIGVTHVKAIRIANIYPVGNKLLSNDEVVSIVKSEISGSYWFLFPKDNIVYFPRRAIENAFLKNHLEVRSVKVSFKNFNSISVTFKERQPMALACISPETGGACFFIDETGYIFKEGPAYGTDSGYLVFESNSASTTLGATLLPKTEFENIRSFAELLKKQNINLGLVALKNGGVREGQLVGGGKLVWNADEDLGLAYQNLLLLIGSAKFDGKRADGTLSVEYIDLQNQNKVFYKLKGAQ